MTINDVYIPYLTDTSRFLVLYGGGMSGKSVFAAQKLISRIKTEKPHKFLALRKVGATVKDSIYAEIKDVIYTNDLQREFQENRSEHYFTHLPTGNQILCKGLDEPEKIKSIKGITGIWCEETTEFTEDDLDQLNIRIRGEKEHYVQFIYSFNPISEDNHVVKKYIINKEYDPKNTVVLHTDYRSNYFLTEEDRNTLESYKEKNQLFYDVYCLGIPGKVDKSNKFLYAFDDKKHVAKLSRVENHPIRLSFDFNLDPYAVLIYQRIGNSIRIFDKVKSSSDIYQVCEEILTKYPGERFMVTGDVSGKNRTGVVRGKKSYWQAIKEMLNLKDQQIRLRSQNIDLLDSKLLCNSVFLHLDIKLDPSLEEAISDCKYAKVDDHGILIKDRKKQKNDFLDNVRYICDAEFPEIIVNHKKYK